MASMDSYDRVMAILEGSKEEADRVPCVNSASVATIEFMKACDAYWPEAHRNAAKMAKLASAAHRLCGLDNVSVPFCMTVEAEVLGAPVEFFEGNVKWPSVKKFIAEDISDLELPRDLENSGRIPIITEAIKTLKREFGGKVPVNAYVVPPFTSVSSYLVDSVDFLKWLVKSPEKAEQFLRHTADTYRGIANIYQDAGADVITLNEMGASSDNISPKQFETFVKPYLRSIIQGLKAPTVLNICGSTLLIIEQMVECGASAISIEERTPVIKAREIIDGMKRSCPILGNISPFRVIHTGPPDRIRDAVRRAIEEGVNMVAPGSDFWLETPTEHIKALVDATVRYGGRHRAEFPD